MPKPRPNTVNIETGLLLGSSFVQGRGEAFVVTDPCTEEEVVTMRAATAEDIDEAIGIAAEAQKAYYSLGPEQWSSKLHKLADLIDENMHELASLDALCMGRSLSMAADISLASKTIRLCASLAVTHHGQSSQQMSDAFSFTLREPFGVCAAICPWNVPVVLCASKLGPALATGNAIIVKTSERAPLSLILLGKLALAAGIPAGTVQIMHGKGEVGAMLASHPRIRRLAFTGSTVVGRKVLQMAAQSNFKRVTLELGGKGAALVFDDADLKEAVEAIAFSMSWLSGQLCMCQSRIYVHESVAERFIDAFKALYLNTPMGDSFDENSVMGPMVDPRARDSVTKVLENAEKEGGIISQGSIPSGKGFYVPATIIQGLSENSQVVKEEIFGPVVHINTFTTEAEALALANDTEYGLYCSVFTSDGSRAIRCAKGLSSGLISINQSAPVYDLTLPFGGLRQSGLGREWGTEILDEWTEVKSVAWKL
ncbi:hypothetical protein CF319_g1673 [Tilletia indica]|uniref:Aldehyde dehydrogenase domain-containing protein n=1 Tax=Tilletia indica TaxID=43049 RepID=A0A177TNQ1_9BASI|nr:hypothetical protein CF319_g1673 [Tilletia indica]KAE8249285.1 hypothetical protein A4X13_0g5264 [Tilletia indica]